jgi:tetratricopeptide (TPR) repeat protein
MHNFDPNDLLEGFCNAIQLGEAESAAALLSQLKGNGQDSNALQFLTAVLAQAKGAAEAALTEYQRLLADGFWCADLYNNLGNLYRQNKQYELARAVFQQLVNTPPDNTLYLFNFANVEFETGNFNSAKELYERAIALGSHDIQLQLNYANTLLQLGDEPNAEQIYRRVVNRVENDAARVGLGLLKMRQRNWKEGLPLYEYRLAPIQRRHHDDVRNQIEQGSLTNKVLYVKHEQGFGDSIFIKPLLELISQAIKVRLIVETPMPLLNLYHEYDSPLIEYVSPGMLMNVTPTVMLMSIPYVMSGLFDDFVPRKQTPRQIQKRNKLAIGLCWRGSNSHPFSYLRNIPVRDFVSVLDPNHNYVDLTFDPNASEEEYLAHYPFLKKAVKPTTFSDTANTLSKLDALITVDTAVNHLAGELNIPTYLILRKPIDWRWGYGAKISRYPNHRIYYADNERVFMTLRRIRADISADLT